MDLIRTILDTYQAKPNKTPVDALDDAVRKALGRSVETAVHDFHTAMVLKDFRYPSLGAMEKDPRWTWMWLGNPNKVEVAHGSASKPTTLLLSGGVYHFQKLRLEHHARLVCLASCEVRVASHVSLGHHAYLGPTPGQDPARLQLYVAGSDHGLEVGHDGELSARAYVPNGQIDLDKNATSNGTLVAGRIVVGHHATATAAPN